MSAIAVCMGRMLKMGFKLNLPVVLILLSLVLVDIAGIKCILPVFFGVSSISLPSNLLLSYIFFLE